MTSPIPTAPITNARRGAAVVAFVAGGAVLAQAVLNGTAAAAKGESVPMAVLGLFGFFTIWSNTLVALVTARFSMRGANGGFLTRGGTLAAAAVYIIVVGAIYNLLLAKYNPVTGVRLFTDTLLHSVVPIGYVLWWLVLAPRRLLGWNGVLPSMAFPLAYSVVALTRGALAGKYAYFFIDVGKYGWPQVLFNMAGLVVFFGVLMAAVIAFDRAAHRRQNAAPKWAG